MPRRNPIRATIHGLIDRGDYTVEKVFFASHPGHYVTGNLYRPREVDGRVPGILCPHGHWANGRFYDAGEKKAGQQIAKGAEETMAGARYPVQARMAQLARMGCIVFHYDMVGYADSQPIKHASGFTDVEAGLRLQNAMGLQTFNSLCALDFLLSLPEVDPERVGVTGSSGGGTQTFMVCALDPRPAVAFPAVMVSTAMQGGCVCRWP
jgi:dienelactone hydrolase